jgi:hypothetical protein
MSDFDSPWKEALDHYFEAFMAFFFPQAHAVIDWLQGHEMLDKELRQITREAELGRRLVDKLVKVWRKEGEEAWVLIHVEVQGQEEADFPRRMYVYHYRVFDRYNRFVASFAVLADDRADWRPSQFGYSLLGSKIELHFPVAKLLDFSSDLSALEAGSNVFATLVLAHLMAQETRQNPGARRGWKTRLVKGLYDRGLSKDDVRTLFRLIDWMMELPHELEKQFWQDVFVYEQEKQMPFITSVERIGMEKGRQEGRRESLLEGIELALRLKFGKEAGELMSRVERITDFETLHAFFQAIEAATSMDEMRGRAPGE